MKLCDMFFAHLLNMICSKEKIMIISKICVANIILLVTRTYFEHILKEEININRDQSSSLKLR